jgi:uncharacterized protein
MRINVAQLLKEPIGSTRKYQTEESPDLSEVNAIKGKVALIRTHRGLIVRGEMIATVVSMCSRCLKPITYQVSYDFEEEAFPTIDVFTGLPLPTEPESLTIDNSHTLDLTDMLIQYALLTMPIKPLCRPDCAGICPQCGTDLNYSTCPCSARPVDERWRKLMNLKNERGI